MILYEIQEEMRTRGGRVYDRSGFHKITMVRMYKNTDEYPNVQA